MLWWIWILLGIALVSAELFFPLDFFLIFIGLGFLSTGGLVFLEVLPADWLQWTACAAFSLLFYLGLKKPLVRTFTQTASDRKEDYLGEIVALRQDIAPGETGSGELRGTTWQVKNLSTESLLKGTRHSVARTDGIVLIIE